MDEKEAKSVPTGMERPVMRLHHRILLFMPGIKVIDNRHINTWDGANH